MSRRVTFLPVALDAALAFAVACSSGPRSASTLDDTNPMAAADSGAATPSPSSSGSNDAALGDVAPIDSPSSDDTPNAPADGGPRSAPPRCNPGHVWKSLGLIASVTQASFGRIGGISLDERTIAWTSATGTIYVADRVASAGAFGFPSIIDTTLTPVANDRVALAPTGVVLFAVSADRRRFIAFNRASVGTAWSASTRLQFANLDAMITTEGAGQFSEPVLGADGASLFYLFALPAAPLALYESKWDAQQHAWAPGIALANPDFAIANATLRRRPTGAASDGRTFFFFDETTGQERAAWRDAPTSPFVHFVDVTGISEAAPNDPCDTLYFQAENSDSGGAGASIAR